MKKRLIQQELLESLAALRRLITEEGTAVFRAPIVPDDCRSFDKATAAYIRDVRLRLCINSWIIPRIERALNEIK